MQKIIVNFINGLFHPRTFVLKILNTRDVSFSFCKNLKIFSQNQYGSKITRIIDVGANEGQFAFMASYCWPEAQLDCYEPDPEAYCILSNKFKSIESIKTYNIAISNSNDVLILNCGETSAQNSILQEIGKNAAGKIEVQSSTLNDLYTNKELESGISMLKIDVQGFEKQVLLGASQVLRSFNCILVEVSLKEIFIGGVLIDEIWNLLREFGFEYHTIIDSYTDPLTEHIVQLDLLFKK